MGNSCSQLTLVPAPSDIEKVLSLRLRKLASRFDWFRNKPINVTEAQTKLIVSCWMRRCSHMLFSDLQILVARYVVCVWSDHYCSPNINILSNTSSMNTNDGLWHTVLLKQRIYKKENKL